MPFYLTYDLGTTGLKTALVSDDGRIAAVHTEEYSLICPQPDWAEMAPETYWDAVVAGTRAVLARSGAGPAEIAAIGFSSQGETFVPLDADAKPLYNFIVWTDKRAKDIARDWETRWLPREDYRPLSGFAWVPAELSVFKIAWLAANAPRAHKAWRFALLPDYIMFRMTGEIVTDRITAQSSGFYDLRTNDWEPRLLQAAGISASQLPEIVEPCAVAGQLTPGAAGELGLSSGTPVCAGANDQIVGACGAGNVQPGMVTETTGTSLAVVATTDGILPDVRVSVGRHIVPGAWYALPFTITSAIVLKWFRDLCAPSEDYEAFLSGVEEVPPGSGGLAVLPHFGGTGFPTFNPDARGAITGLTLGHTRAHIARAIMESCACSLLECVTPIIESGLPVRSVRSLGGAARSDVWLQMKADMLGIPVERPLCSDAASLGAAMLAAVGVGRFPSVVEASSAWYRPDRRFEPNAGTHSQCREVYARYQSLYEKLYGRAEEG